MSSQTFWGGNGTQRIPLVLFLFDILHVLIGGSSLYSWYSKQSIFIKSCYVIITNIYIYFLQVGYYTTLQKWEVQSQVESGWNRFRLWERILTILMLMKELKVKSLRGAHSHIWISPSSQCFNFVELHEKDFQKKFELEGRWKSSRMESNKIVDCKSINVTHTTYSYFQVRLPNKILNSWILNHPKHFLNKN